MASPTWNMELSGMLPLGEKWKILNQLVARTERHEVDTILNDCTDQPTSLFNLVKFLLADKFHRFDLMVELLYAGDTALLNRIIPKRWMYEGDENCLTDSQFLLEQLFPKVSYICRQKVLHRIGRYARNEVKIDQLWNSVNQIYGFDVAFPLFEACSKNVIASVIANRKVKLSGYQVVTLLQKYPAIGLKYFKNNVVKCSKMNPQCSPIHYLYKHRPEDFLDLFFNHSRKLRDFSIGRNRSTKMIRAHRTKLLEHPEKTSSLLKRDRIQREFTAEEFQRLFESTLPQDPINVENSWKWVRKVPTYRQINMVNQAYANLYKIDLNEHPNYMSEEYIFLLPDEQRLQVVEWKIENAEKESYCLSWSFKGFHEFTYKKERALFFLPLKPISHSAPELKKLFLIEQKVENRVVLCRYLIQTCYFNNNLPELLSVLKLLNKRCRNDQPEVLRAILRSVNQIKKMEFSKEHWDIIMELIQVSLVFNYDCSEHEELIGKLIAYRLNSKLPVDDLVAMHIKMKIQRYRPSLYNVPIKDPSDERVLLELYSKELERLAQSNDLCGYDGSTCSDEELTQFVIKLIDRIWRFNCDNKRSDVEQISVSSHPWLISNFERIAKREELRLDEDCKASATVPLTRYDFWKRPNKLLERIQWLRDEQNQTIDAFHGSDYFFSKMWLCLPNHQTIRHFLEKNPSHLLENWTASISKMLGLRACVALMRTLKYWNYTALVSQTVNDCIEIVRAELGDKPAEFEIRRKCNALLVLSTLMEPSDFLALVTEYYPTDTKVDVFAEKSEEDYKMTVAITRSLINVPIPHLAFDALKKFSVGDYLKLVIDSLYSQIQRAQSTKCLDFLRQQLVNVPVSLHKHIIRLYCTISSVDEKLQLLKCVESPNVTIRYVVFHQMGKLFRSYPTQETWTLLKSAIESTTVEDAKILEFLHSTPELHTCPLEFISDYTNACLTVLRKLKPSEVDTFIDRLLKIIKRLPDHSLDSIFMHDVENADSFNSKFCVEYLKISSSPSILEHRLSNIYRVLDNVIRRGWDRKSEGQTYSTRSLVYGFIDDLADKIGDSSEAWRENQICQTLLDKFKALSATKFFMEIFTLHLALLHVEVIKYDGTERLKRFGSSFAKIVDSLANGHGNEIIVIVLSKIESAINRIFSTEISKNQYVVLELVDEILKASRTRSNQIVAIKLLAGVNPKTAHRIEMLEKIIKMFIESDDVVIQTYFTSISEKQRTRKFVGYSRKRAFC